MRKRFRLGMMLVSAALFLCACRPLVTDEKEPLTVCATFYPIYALTEAVTRDVPDLTLCCLVQPRDGCLRNYQLSDWDAALLSGSDAIIAGGRGLESFESTLYAFGENGPAVSTILYNLELYASEGSHTDSESHLDGANPHYYMSVPGAKTLIETVGATFMTLDPRYAEIYSNNITAASDALDALQSETQAELKDVSGGKVALMNEALIYVAQDYGLEPAARIDRESGAGMDDVELTECLDVLEKSDAKVVLIEKQAPKALIDALEDAGYAVAQMDVLSTHSEADGFATYIKAQQENAAAIRRAFEDFEKQEERP